MQRTSFEDFQNFVGTAFATDILLIRSKDAIDRHHESRATELQKENRSSNCAGASRGSSAFRVPGAKRDDGSSIKPCIACPQLHSHKQPVAMKMDAQSACPGVTAWRIVALMTGGDGQQQLCLTNRRLRCSAVCRS